MSSPTARTLAHLRKLGYDADTVERYNHHKRRKNDYIGIIDVIAFTDNSVLTGRGEFLGVQATSDETGGNGSERIKKALAEPRLKRWLRAGGRMEVWAWRKLQQKTKAGKTIERWHPKITSIVLNSEGELEAVAA